MNSINYQYENMSDSSIHLLTVHALENFKFFHSLSGYGDYDCQQLFLKGNGLKALFYIKSVQAPLTEEARIGNKEIFNEI